MNPAPAASAVQHSGSHPRDRRASHRLRTALIAVAALVAEIAAFRAAFTTDHLIGSGLWWAEAIRLSRHAVPFLLCLIAGIALLAAPALAVFLKRAGRRTPATELRWRSALAHAVALLLFFGTSRLVLGPDIGSMPASGLLAATWVAAGLAVLLTAVDWCWPLRSLFGVIWPLRGPILAGAALGVLAYFVGDWLLTEMPLWEHLAWGTMQVTDALLGLVLGEASRHVDPATRVIQTFGDGTWRTPIEVAAPCSGYQGIVLLLSFLTVFLFVARKRLRFPAALWLLPLGAVAVWLLNGVRITILLLVNHYVSTQAAMEGFHEYGGWPFLALAALGCVAVATRSPAFARRPHRPPEGESVATGSSPAPYVAPLVMTTAVLMVARAAWLPEVWVRIGQIGGVAALVIAFRSDYRQILTRISKSAILVGLLGAIAWVLLQPSATDGSRWLEIAAEPDAFTRTALGLVTAIGYLAVAPLVEELAFRGYLLRRLVSARFDGVDPRAVTALAVAASSLAFGALHDAWLAGTACGALYAWAYARRGNLGDAVLAHAVTNASLLAAAAATGHWQWAS